MKPTVLDLFSGIGGFALAFEAAGFETVAFAETAVYQSRILAKHWPSVPNLGDVKGIDGSEYAGTDVVCGGFPCQDISSAGKGAGIHGERSGLWFEMLRIIRGARPRFCLLENVPALRTRGADDVLGGLEESGYACRAFVVGAVHAGAPHRRQRAWIVAYRSAPGLPLRGQSRLGELQTEVGAGVDARPSVQGSPMAHADDAGQLPVEGTGEARDDLGRRGAHASHSESPWISEWEGRGFGVAPYTRLARDRWWAAEPGLGRVAHGIPNRVDRIKSLGNSIVPAVAYPFALWMKDQIAKEIA